MRWFLPPSPFLQEDELVCISSFRVTCRTNSSKLVMNYLHPAPDRRHRLPRMTSV